MRLNFSSTAALAAAALCALSAPAALAAYPDKPIRIVVTFAAGGASDIVARVISEPLGKALGTTVIVDNKPGAGGTLGGQDVVRAAPDGYTLMLSNSTPLSIGPFTVPKQPYDPIKQFTHVALLGVAPVLIMANPKTGPATLKDLPKATAADPGYSFGSGGPGSIGHIVGEMTKSAMKVQMTHIPYKGGAPMTTDLIAGTIPVGIDVITAYVPMMKSGQIKGLAVTSQGAFAAGARRAHRGRTRPADAGGRELLRRLRPGRPAQGRERQAACRAGQGDGRPSHRQALRGAGHHAGQGQLGRVCRRGGTAGQRLGPDHQGRRSEVTPPRSAYGAPPQGGDAGGPAKPDPRRLLVLRVGVARVAYFGAWGG